ncbi:hypothetical protein [Floridanema aerugineum]|uniref:Uncharacterized protein n=1 Tax=Floridaenema aerugineum BLCC-F46 TaxID=3153654 RepID=A0ABV4WYA4_9CYAN
MQPGRQVLSEAIVVMLLENLCFGTGHYNVALTSASILTARREQIVQIAQVNNTKTSQAKDTKNQGDDDDPIVPAK